MTTLEERRRTIAELVTKHGGLSVEELAEQLSVSESTVRRDLRDLADRQLVERTHGGAVPVTAVGVAQTFDRRVVQQLNRKQAIAEQAVKEIQDGQVVYFDAGTTTIQIAAAAPTDCEFIAVTNSPLFAPDLASGDATVKLTGGEFSEETKALTGPTTESYIRASNFDLAFLGVNGIEPDGTLSAPNEAEACLKRLVAANTSRTVAVTVTEKFGDRSFRRFGSIDDIDVLVTDGRVPDDFRELFAEIELVEDAYG